MVEELGSARFKKFSLDGRKSSESKLENIFNEEKIKK